MKTFAHVDPTLKRVAWCLARTHTKTKFRFPTLKRFRLNKESTLLRNCRPSERLASGNNELTRLAT